MLPAMGHDFRTRLTTVDTVRGFAVMGILAMNIVGFALPGSAYLNPTVAGGADGANLWSWLLSAIFFDGKMRALFAMLFGASILLIAERDDGPGMVRRHLARMAVLLLIGMVHAWLIWSGDILVTYAVIGILVFPWRSWSPKRLFLVAILCLAGQASINFSGAVSGMHMERLVAAGTATQADHAALKGLRATTKTSPENAAQEITAMRGNWASVQQARAASTFAMQTAIIPLAMLLETVGLMLLGMGLYRLGWWQGWRDRADYRNIALFLTPAALLAGAVLPWRYAVGGFDTIGFLWMDGARVLIGPLVAIGYSALLILLVQSGGARWLTDRLAAAGQMALTNYLMTSILMTTIFYGTGLGLFGALDRAQLWLPVLLMWALILLWSKPWLGRFVQGPFEWLWRSLARLKPQPFLRRVPQSPLSRQ